MNKQQMIITTIGLGALFYMYSMDDGHKNVVQQIEAQKMGEIVQKVTPKIVIEAEPLEPGDTLLSEFNLVKVSGNKYKNMKVVKAYDELYIRDWGIRRQLENGEVDKLKENADRYLEWFKEDVENLENTLTEVNYDKNQTNTAIDGSYYKGDIDTLRKHVNEVMDFLGKI